MRIDFVNMSVNEGVTILAVIFVATAPARVAILLSGAI